MTSRHTFMIASSVAFVIMASMVHGGESRHVAPPEWCFADTESSTNVSFVVRGDGVKCFNVSIELDAASSNNVEVAFGVDSNTNGVLDRVEREFIVGWDCGDWMMRNIQTGCELRCPRRPSLQKLSFEMRVDSDDAPMELAALEHWAALFEGGESIATFNSGWNVVRVTSRGPQATDAVVDAVAAPYGISLMIK